MDKWIRDSNRPIDRVIEYGIFFRHVANIKHESSGK